jgi:hypothetical protein
MIGRVRMVFVLIVVSSFSCPTSPLGLRQVAFPWTGAAAVFCGGASPMIPRCFV